MLHHGVVRGAGAQNSDVLSGRKEMGLAPLFGSGGMPSSHTAFVVSLTLMIGATQGFDSAIFALSFTMAAIVMYDATGVRRETGKQAVIINEIVQKMFVNGESITDEELKELVGHTHVEVIGGVIVGLLTAGLFLLFM